MNRYRLPRWAPAAGLLLALLGLLLAWLLHGYVRDLLIVPAAYLAWLALRLFESLDQEAVLLLAVMVAAVNLVLLLIKAWELPPVSWPEIAIQGRVSAWLDLLPLAQQKGFVGKMPIRQLSLLLVNVLEQREQRPRNELWSALRAGTLPLAPEVQQYLQTGQSHRVKPAPVAPGDEQEHGVFADPEVEALISFLEQTMEIEDER